MTIYKRGNNITSALKFIVKDSTPVTFMQALTLSYMCRVVEGYRDKFYFNPCPVCNETMYNHYCILRVRERK